MEDWYCVPSGLLSIRRTGTVPGVDYRVYGGLELCLSRTVEYTYTEDW